MSVRTITTAVVLLSLAPAIAAPSRLNTAAGGGYVTTCVTARSNGSGFSPGTDISTDFTAGLCSSDTYANGGSASAQQSPTAGDILFGGAAGQVSPGQIHLGSQYAIGLQGAQFPLTAAAGGYEFFGVPTLAGHEGEQGYLLVDLVVSGALKANGNAGSAQFQLQIFKNDGVVFKGAPGFNPGTGTEISTDRQWLRWAVASFPPPFEGDSDTIGETVTFSVPVTWGTGLTLGVYGEAVTGGRNQSGFGSATSDFMHSVYWGGVAGAFVAGQFVSNGLGLASNDGLDWMRSFVPTSTGPGNGVPAPGTAALTALAVAALVGSRRRARRA